MGFLRQRKWNIKKGEDIMKHLNIIVVVCILFFVGCSTQRFYLNPALVTYSREKLEKSSTVRLPDHWNLDNFKKITLGLHVTKGGTTIDRAMNARLQTEISKLKRFQVYSAYNVAGKTLFMNLADIGEAEFKEPTRQPALNYILNVKLDVNKSNRRVSNRKYYRYEVSCDWSLEDLAKQEVADSGVAKGITERLQYYTLNGIFIGGFVEADEDEAICSATMKALSVIANKIGNMYPVGGSITAVSQSGERLTLDKGFVDGIGKYHQVAIFQRRGKEKGVAIPIALAEAMPGCKQSNLHVYKWNDSDEDGRILVNAYRSNPKAFAKKNNLFAVAYGMPVPPEWEQDNTEADEKYRLRLK